jgi:pimeloyl-ACP methyl ester carboxylesterase
MDYITFGKGTKPLIMIQGLSTAGIKGLGFFISLMYRFLAKDYKVYLFDRRDQLWAGISIEDFAKDLAIAMDAFEIKKAHIIGVSQGGMIAQYLAINRPDLVDKLILVVTLSRNNSTVQTVINNWITLAKQNDIRRFVEDMTRKTYSDTYFKRYKFLIPLLAIMQKPNNIRRFIILAESCLTCNTYDDLKAIQCPVFVIGAGKDQIVTGEASEEIAKQLNCKIHMYENAGHAVHQECKDFNQRVYDFLRE